MWFCSPVTTPMGPSMFAKLRAVRPGSFAIRRHGHATRVTYPCNTRPLTNSSHGVVEDPMKKCTRQVAVLIAGLLLFCYSFVTDSVHGKAVNTASGPNTGAGQPSGAPKKLALLVGINNYKYPDRISPLAGSINDVEDMRQVLTGKFEFLPENIVVLKDSQATHAAIIQAIQTLIAKAQPGDIV